MCDQVFPEEGYQELYDAAAEALAAGKPAIHRATYTVVANSRQAVPGGWKVGLEDFPCSWHVCWTPAPVGHQSVHLAQQPVYPWSLQGELPGVHGCCSADTNHLAAGTLLR